MADTKETQGRVFPKSPDRYLRSPRGIFHLRASIDPENDWWSYGRSRCGWENDLGKDRVPGLLPEGFESRVCKKCVRIEPS